MAVKTVFEDEAKVSQARKVIAFTIDRVKVEGKAKFAGIQDEARRLYGINPNPGTIQRSSYQIKVNPSPRNLAVSADGSRQSRT